MKKAQTEMLGMAIVILLISIGILILVGNVLKSSSSPSTKKLYSEKQLATNVLGSMLSTTTNCNNERISTLMMDCGRDRVISCPDQIVGDVTINGNEDICQYLNDTIYFMLDSTLKHWGKKYSFLAYTERTDPLINITYRVEECMGELNDGEQYLQKEFYYLPLQYGSMTVELAICS